MLNQGTRIYFDSYWNDHCYGTSDAGSVSVHVLPLGVAQGLPLQCCTGLAGRSIFFSVQRLGYLVRTATHAHLQSNSTRN
jgi:hypothetical protein